MAGNFASVAAKAVKVVASSTSSSITTNLHTNQALLHPFRATVLPHIATAAYLPAHRVFDDPAELLALLLPVVPGQKGRKVKHTSLGQTSFNELTIQL